MEVEQKAGRTEAGRESVSKVGKGFQNNGVLHEAGFYTGHFAVLSPSQMPRVGQGFTGATQHGRAPSGQNQTSGLTKSVSPKPVCLPLCSQWCMCARARVCVCCDSGQCVECLCFWL